MNSPNTNSTFNVKVIEVHLHSTCIAIHTMQEKHLPWISFDSSSIGRLMDLDRYMHTVYTNNLLHTI